VQQEFFRSFLFCDGFRNINIKGQRVQLKEYYKDLEYRFHYRLSKLDRSVQWNLDLRKPGLRKNLDLRKVVAATDFFVHKLFDLREIF